MAAARLAMMLCLAAAYAPAVGAAEQNRLVVVLYPEANNGSPGNLLADQSIRATFAAGSEQHVEIHNEYLDVSRFPDTDYQQELASFLRRKYEGRKIDLVLAGLGSALDYAIKHRSEIFPNVPIIFLAVDQQGLAARRLDADVIGVPIRFDLADSLDLALRLHPGTQRVDVVVGKSTFDAYWEAEARKVFAPFESRVQLNYLSGLPMEELLQRAASLPDGSLVYYLHVFQDGDGRVHVPADVLSQLSAVANAPVYSHVDSYIGRGIVGGRVFSFEAEGRHAAQLGLRLLAGETPERIGIQPVSENSYMFDWRQLQRWNISEASLPTGSIVRYKQLGLWDLYKWHIISLLTLCVAQAVLIAHLIGQRSRRRKTDLALRESRAELQELTGKLLGAQEMERRRIARELHDDCGQNLALLSVEMDLLRQRPPETREQLGSRIEAISGQVKQLSSSIHELSHQLHPMKLEQLGLVPALRGLCNELSHAHGMNVDFIHDQAPEAIPADVSLCLFRIAQEALHNVVKHSKARHARVDLRGYGDGISLRVSDDGVGFDPIALVNQGGLGLVSMRERLRLVNGELALETRPSGGVLLDARVPLRIPVSDEVEWPVVLA